MRYLLLLSFLASSTNAQQQQFIKCNFPDFYFEYACLIEEAFVTSENEPIIFQGEHNLPNHSDINVTGIYATPQFNGNLNVLTRDILIKFPNIQFISFWNVSLERIAFDALQNCGKIETISLQFNSITNLINGGFRNCQNVLSLVLSFNGIENIPSMAFNGLNNLESLRLERNRLTEFHADVLNGLTRLKLLDLSGNDIKTLDFLYDLTNLEDFRCSSCQITFIMSELFYYGSNLKFLYLDINDITNFPPSLYENLPNLERLEIGMNKIRRLSIEPHIIHENLTWIGVDYNQINEIDPNFFDSFPNLLAFSAGNNLCINETVNDVKNINFEVDTTFNQCFYNWFNPTTPGSGSKRVEGFLIVFIVGIYLSLKI